MILKLYLVLVYLTATFSSASAQIFEEVLKTDPLYKLYEESIKDLKRDIEEKQEFDYTVSVFKGA